METAEQRSPASPQAALRPWKPRNCENCHADDLQAFRIEGEGTFWRCQTCGLYQKGCPVPSQYYNCDYHAHYRRHHARKIRTASDRLNQVRGMVEASTPRLLDIGSSVGAVLEVAERMGWRPYGVDVSREAVDHCRDRGLLCHHYDGFRLPFPSMFFDVVTAWHVVEHVPCVRTALDEWLRVLRPGGLIVMETPAANCWKARLLGARYRKFWPMEHTYTFTRDTLISFLCDAGFEIVSPSIPIPVVPGRQSLYVAFRRLQLGVSRYIGASKSFVVFARRPVRPSLGLRPWRSA